MDAEHTAELRRIEDEAVALCRDERGRVDHIAAAGHRRDELAGLESGGHTWAAVVRDSAEIDGHRRAIARRLKATEVAVPMPSGAVTMPASYSRRRKEGGTQLTLWMHLPVDELQGIVDEMLRRSRVLSERGAAMRFGIDLARKHGVSTAAEGFAAEGITIAEDVA